MKKFKPSKNALIFIVFVGIIFLIGGILYQYLEKDTSATITAVVKYKGNDYMIVTDVDNNEYKLNTREGILENDVVSIDIDHINQKVFPKTANIKKIDVISKTIHFTVSSDAKDDENIESENITSAMADSSVNKVTYQEEDIISYIDNLIWEIDNYSSNTISQSIKEKFVTVVDFLFYDGEIYGKKFSDLSNSCKLKVLAFVLKMDNKIEEKFPHYKEEVSTVGTRVYTNVKTKVLEIYLDTTVEMCSKDEDLCTSAKDGLRDLKNSFSLTWSNLKEILKENKDKLKSWYEVWRECE